MRKYLIEELKGHITEVAALILTDASVMVVYPDGVHHHMSKDYWDTVLVS